MGTLDFGENFTPRNQLTTKTRFWVQRYRPANPYRVSWRSVQGTKKRKKAPLGWTFHRHPQTTPLYVHFSFCACVVGSPTSPMPSFISIGSAVSAPGGRNSPFPIGLENMALTTVLLYALTCYTVIAKTKTKLEIKALSHAGQCIPAGSSISLPRRC